MLQVYKACLQQHGKVLSQLADILYFLLQLQVMKQGDDCMEAVRRHLVEDKSPNVVWVLLLQ